MSSAASLGGSRTVSERKLPVRVTPPRSEGAHDIVARAFELVYFIHRDRQAALRVVASALMKLDVATARQDKRLYYNPTGRFGRPRTKVVVDRPQLLQRLLMIESDPLERAREHSGEVERDDLLVHFIKELVRITVKRNSFYVTLGTSRLLHNYTTAETMHVYDALGGDPVHMRDDSYYRSRKSQLMSEIQERFGKLLAVVRSSRGEDRFRSRGTTSRERELIHEAMSLLTPWGTVCAGESGHTGNSGEDPMDDELSRFHTILHSTCYERLTSSLDLPEPDSRLEVPQFERETDDDRESRDRRATLLDEERNQLESMLDNASRKRRGVSVWRVRVVVDGIDRVTFDASDGGAELSVAENAELIELVSGQGDQAVVLATHLLTHDLEAVEGITVEGGQQITMHVSPVRDGGAHLAIEYRQRGWADLRTRLTRWATGFIKVAAPVTAAVALAFLVLQPTADVTPPPAAARPEPIQAPALKAVPLPASPEPAAQRARPSSAAKPLTRGAAPETGVALRQVRTIWIAASDDLATALAGSLGGRWSVSASPDDADAALKITSAHPGAVRVRLVNASGEVLWPAQQEGRVYEGEARTVAERIAADLISASARH